MTLPAIPRGLRPVVAVIVVALFAWWALGGRSGGVDARWVAVEREDLVIGVDVEGQLRSEDSSSLGPPPVPWIWDYKISMMADEGEFIEQGQPVLGFDTSELQRALQTELAESDEARKEIEKELAQQSLDRERDELALAEALGRRRKARMKIEVPGGSWRRRGNCVP